MAHPRRLRRWTGCGRVSCFVFSNIQSYLTTRFSALCPEQSKCLAALTRPIGKGLAVTTITLHPGIRSEVCVSSLTGQLSSSHRDSVQYVVEGLRSVLWGKACEISTLVSLTQTFCDALTQGSLQAARQQLLCGGRVNLAAMTLLTWL